MKYINLNKLPQRVPYDRYGKGFNDCLDQVLDAVEEKDLVEVVRCKDCKRYIAEYCTRDIKGRTNMFYMQPTDFCSYGELKELKKC